MKSKVYTAKPILKMGEPEPGQDKGAFICFAEYLDIPGLNDADIRIEFESENSYEEIKKLISELNRKGMIFVVEKGSGSSRTQEI